MFALRDLNLAYILPILLPAMTGLVVLAYRDNEAYRNLVRNLKWVAVGAFVTHVFLHSLSVTWWIDEVFIPDPSDDALTRLEEADGALDLAYAEEDLRALRSAGDAAVRAGYSLERRLEYLEESGQRGLRSIQEIQVALALGAVALYFFGFLYYLPSFLGKAKSQEKGAVGPTTTTEPEE